MSILFMKDATLKLKLTGGGSLVEYNQNVQSCEVEVSPGDEQTYPTLDGNVAKSVGPPTYALVIKAAQEWNPTTGLARFLWDNEGASLDFEYQAHGKSVTTTTILPRIVGTCKAIPGNYGGEVGTFPEIEVTLPCTAKPVLTLT